MASAFPLIAAASTWRSFGSGIQDSASLKLSGTSTVASGKKLLMKRSLRSRCASVSPKSLTKETPTSWRIGSLQRGRYRAGSSANRRSSSHNGIGIRTQESSSTEYSLSGVRIMGHFLVDPLVVLRARQIVECVSTSSIALSFVGQRITCVNTPMRADLVVWDLAFL